MPPPLRVVGAGVLHAGVSPAARARCGAAAGLRLAGGGLDQPRHLRETLLVPGATRPRSCGAVVRAAWLALKRDHGPPGLVTCDAFRGRGLLPRARRPSVAYLRRCPALSRGSGIVPPAVALSLPCRSAPAAPLSLRLARRRVTRPVPPALRGRPRYSQPLPLDRSSVLSGFVPAVCAGRPGRRLSR